MLKSLRNRLPLLNAFPMSQDSARRPAAVEGAIVLSPAPAQDATVSLSKDDAEELRVVPPLEEWAAAVQCSVCRKWRPCTAEEAPKLMGADSGFACKQLGFSCNQEQVYSTE